MKQVAEGIWNAKAARDLSHIEFNPQWPPALQAAIDRVKKTAD